MNAIHTIDAKRFGFFFNEKIHLTNSNKGGRPEAMQKCKPQPNHKLLIDNPRETETELYILNTGFDVKCNETQSINAKKSVTNIHFLKMKMTKCIHKHSPAMAKPYQMHCRHSDFYSDTLMHWRN